MRHYTTNGGGAFNNFGEVVDYLKNTSHSVLLKGCPKYRAALLKNSDGSYRLKIFYVGWDFNAYYEVEYDFGYRLSAKKIAKIEAIMDEAADNYYEPNIDEKYAIEYLSKFSIEAAYNDAENGVTKSAEEFYETLSAECVKRGINLDILDMYFNGYYNSDYKKHFNA